MSKVNEILLSIFPRSSGYVFSNLSMLIRLWQEPAGQQFHLSVQICVL